MRESRLQCVKHFKHEYFKFDMFYALLNQLVYIKRAFKEPWVKKSFLKINVINLIYVVKCFPLSIIILITAKVNMNFIFYFLFFAIFPVFHVFLKIIPLSDVPC